MDNGRRDWLKRLKLPFRIIISCILLIQLFRLLDSTLIVSIILDSSIVLIVLAIIIAFCTFIPYTMRVSNILNGLRLRYSFFVMLRVNMIANLFNFALPGQVAGEVSRFLYLKNFAIRSKPSSQLLAGVLILDRILGLVSLLLILVAVLVVNWSSLGQGITLFALLLILTLLAWLFTRILYCIFSKLNSTQDSNIKDNWRLGLYTIRSFGTILSKPLLMAKVQFHSYIFHFIAAMVFMFCGLAVGIDVSYVNWLFLYAFVSVVQLVPVTFGGLGLREAVYITYFANLGVLPEQALSASLLVFSCWLCLAFGGLVVYMLGYRIDGGR